MYIHIASWGYNDWVSEAAKLTMREQRALLSRIDNSADLARLSLTTAHNKLQGYLNTPDPPTPPTSPSYFSDDALEILEEPHDMESNTELNTDQTTKDLRPNSPKSLSDS